MNQKHWPCVLLIWSATSGHSCKHPAYLITDHWFVNLGTLSCLWCHVALTHTYYFMEWSFFPLREKTVLFLYFASRNDLPFLWATVIPRHIGEWGATWGRSRWVAHMSTASSRFSLRVLNWQTRRMVYLARVDFPVVESIPEVLERAGDWRIRFSFMSVSNITATKELSVYWVEYAFALLSDSFVILPTSTQHL